MAFQGSGHFLKGLRSSGKARLQNARPLKPWSNGLASSRKLKTWVHLRLRLARPCMHLRWLAMTCDHFGRDQICTQVNTSFLPFGHPTQVSSQVQLAATCDHLRVRLTRALETITTFSHEYPWTCKVLETISKGTLCTTCTSPWYVVFFNKKKKDVFVYQPTVFLWLVSGGHAQNLKCNFLFWANILSLCSRRMAWRVSPLQRQDIKFSWLNSLLSRKKQDIASLLT